MGEGFEVAGERCRVETTLGQGGHVVVITVEALAAGDDLDPAEEQVEAVRCARAVGIGDPRRSTASGAADRTARSISSITAATRDMTVR